MRVHSEHRSILYDFMQNLRSRFLFPHTYIYNWALMISLLANLWPDWRALKLVDAPNVEWYLLFWDVRKKQADFFFFLFLCRRTRLQLCMNSYIDRFWRWNPFFSCFGQNFLLHIWVQYMCNCETTFCVCLYQLLHIEGGKSSFSIYTSTIHM